VSLSARAWIFFKHKNEPWYNSIKNHLEIRYQAIENRMIESFSYVTPDSSNRKTHSFTFASILRDVGSVFDSTLRKLIEKTGQKCEDDIYGFLKFLEIYVPHIENSTVYFRMSSKILIPLKKGEKGLPIWWHAYNDVKHDESSSYWQGNLENALNSLAALAILHTVVCGRTASSIFANIAIMYPLGDPSVSEERLLFPQYACDDKL